MGLGEQLSGIGLVIDRRNVAEVTEMFQNWIVIIVVHFYKCTANHLIVYFRQIII